MLPLIRIIAINHGLTSIRNVKKENKMKFQSFAVFCVMGVLSTPITLVAETNKVNVCLSVVKESAETATNQLGRLRVIFTNVSRSDVRLLRTFTNESNLQHWFSVSITDFSGTPELSTSAMGKISLRRDMEYVVLKTQESFGFVMDYRTLVPILSSGKYRVRIIYHNQYGENCFRGMLESNSIEVVIP